MQKGVSLIICTYNGLERLFATLEAVWRVDKSVLKELILVDNASTDGTGEWVRNYFENKKSDFSAKYILESKPGLLNARIAGIQSASFEILLFCDDDNWLFPDYLTLGFGIMDSNSKIGVLGGYGIPKLEEPQPEWLPRYQKSFALGPQFTSSGKLPDIPSHVFGAASFFRKQPLLDLIESDYRFYLTGRTGSQAISGDDLELCWLMQLMGYEIHYEEKLKFFHALPKSRVNTNYLIKMKSGTAAGSALLFGYRYYLKFPDASSWAFSQAYFIERAKAVLVYFKNRLTHVGKVKSWESDLALAILDARQKSFSANATSAKYLFLQLQSFRHFWKLIA